VSARLHHPAEPPAGAVEAPWPLRFADFDLLGHVNNAATWAAVEEVLAARRDLRSPYRAELEYRAPVERGHRVVLAHLDEPDGLALWLLDAADGHALVTGRVRRGVGSPGATAARETR
jgi:hypothetical protein